MTKLVLLFLFLLVVVAVVYLDKQTQWQYIATTDTHSQLFFDTHFDKNGNDIEVWEKIDPTNSTDSELQNYEQILILIKFSCHTQQYKMVWMQKTPKFGLQHQGMSVEDFWHFILPDSAEYKIFQQVCPSTI